MDRSSRHRVWKVEELFSKTEKLCSAVLAKQEKSRPPSEETLKIVRPVTRWHATAVAAIIISGKPKNGEPLVRAWQRTLACHRIDVENCDQHKAAEKMYPAIVEDPDYARLGHWWDSFIVHATESARFTEIFSNAPGWLLEFTRIRLDAHALKFKLPETSGELVWGVDGVMDSKRWPLLPRGTMGAGGPLPKAPESDLTPEEQRFYREMKARPCEEWSRSERRLMSDLIKRVPFEK
jgi:hypothetical protein